MKLNRRTYSYQRPEEEMDNPYIPELPTSTPADAPVRDPSIFDPDGSNPGPYKDLISDQQCGILMEMVIPVVDRSVHSIFQI